MTATLDAPPVAEKPPLFGKKEKRAVLDPLWDNNPIALQVLGICSALAVTIKVQQTLIMCAAVIAVVSMTNTIISLLRKMIPNNIRIIVQLVVISSVVTIVSLFLQAYVFDASKQLSVFVGLIVTNCIVMGRAEAFAMANGPFRSFLDGFGNAVGYAWILLVVSVLREVLGAGTILGARVIPQSWYLEHGGWYVNNGLMVLAPGAFLLLGIIIWVQRSISGYSEAH
ncbi:MAG: NADH:ubiquinone reductase (Na(+)-transporting) subunit D [Planctomycetes bacterium]|nr:NADH:ubiquinone reductase (Na(+)-transporting) subunit D [Planctomycetota bacterium]MCB9889176.1 NADH:ubiquinone reductase (Na(+)-transporting) subunit D [Planctomycetota bacterium]